MTFLLRKTVSFVTFVYEFMDVCNFTTKTNDSNLIRYSSAGLQITSGSRLIFADSHAMIHLSMMVSLIISPFLQISIGFSELATEAVLAIVNYLLYNV